MTWKWLVFLGILCALFSKEIDRLLSGHDTLKKVILTVLAGVVLLLIGVVVSVS